MYLPIDWYTFPDGRFHIVVPHPNGDENRWQTHRQTGTADDSHRLLQWSVYIARCRLPGMPILRTLQLRFVDVAVEPGHLHNILDTVSVSTLPRSGVPSDIRHIYDQICVLHAGRCHVERVAVFRQDVGQLAHVC